MGDNVSLEKMWVVFTLDTFGMSALGQKQTCAAHKPMSAKLPIADIPSLFDQLVGGDQQAGRDG
jgi:hypothetical protein